MVIFRQGILINFFKIFLAGINISYGQDQPSGVSYKAVILFCNICSVFRTECIPVRNVLILFYIFVRNIHFFLIGSKKACRQPVGLINARVCNYIVCIVAVIYGFHIVIVFKHRRIHPVSVESKERNRHWYGAVYVDISVDIHSVLIAFKIFPVAV